MLKIELLESFIAAAETSNISKAAERVCRTQSAVSLQIKKLEQSTGQVLFNRDNRGIKLTQAGQKLLNYAYQLVQLNLQALDDLSSNNEREVIRLGVPTDYVRWYLKSGLIEFVREFTHYQLTIDTDVSGNLLKRLDAGEFDAIIATHWQHPDNGQLLFERHFKWVSATNAKVLQQDVLQMGLYPENCPIRVQVFANHQLSMRPIRVMLSTPSPDALCMAVEEDLVVAPVAEFRISDKMQVLDPKEHGLPPLPAFNESLYTNPNSDAEALAHLHSLLKANLNEMVHSH